MNDFYIPIENNISDFINHLRANPRTILSSKFGDGKSFFLDKLKADEKIKDEFEFLTIYPVNYQVVENKDIFEMIKRDLMLQLAFRGIIQEDTEIKVSDIDAFMLYLNSEHKNLLLDIFSTLAEVGIEMENNEILLAIAGMKIFKSIKRKYRHFKKKLAETESDYLEKFIDRVGRKTIYENDVISKIITSAIDQWKLKSKKRLVLFIEDLDRIDPAHLFRILNVLSAHMDYGYKYLKSPDRESFAGNKFHLDNIVLAIDYKNLHHIYQHFYGIHTDFNGYISKFLSSVPFRYSLAEVKRQYILDRLVEKTTLPQDMIEAILPDDLIKSKTIRETVQSFKIEYQLRKQPTVMVRDEVIYLNTSLLKLMAFMRRLKISDQEIVDSVFQYKSLNIENFIEYVGAFFFMTIPGDQVYVKLRDGNGKLYAQAVKLRVFGPTSGTAVLGYSTTSVVADDEKETDFRLLVQEMLTLISK